MHLEYRCTLCQTDSVVERVPLNIKQIITVTHGSIIKKQR